MNRLSPIHWLGVALGALFVALFTFNDSGPFPVFKPTTTEVRVTPREADSQVLDSFAAALRSIWDKDQQADANYRSGTAAAVRSRDAKAFAIVVADWDSSLRDIQSDLQGVKVPPTANGKLKALLDESATAFAGTLAIERRIAQRVLVMLSTKVDISKEIAGEMKEANMASVRSVLALHSAYQLLGMEPPPEPQRQRNGSDRP